MGRRAGPGGPVLGSCARAQRLSFLALTMGCIPLAARAQDARLKVRVEYIAGANVYLSAGTAAGLAAGDTLAVARVAATSLLGRFLVVSATETRSVVAFASAPFRITLGDSLEVTRVGRGSPVGTPPADTAAARPTRTAQPPPPVAVPVPSSAEARATAPGLSGGRGPRIAGRLALDLDAIHTRSQFNTGPFDLVGQGSVIPTARLRATITQLPGDVELHTNLRYAYRSGGLIEPAPSLRFYELSVEKDFRTAPLQLQLGRFYDERDPFGGYWDGASAHLGSSRWGGNGPGLGVSVGYTPVLGNEGFITRTLRWGASVDYRYQGGALGYAADLAFRQASNTDTIMAPDRTVGGWQRLRWHRWWLDQRLQLAVDPANGRWSLTQLDISLTNPLGGAFSLRTHYSRHRYDWAGLTDTFFSPPREEAGVGLSYSGARASFTAAATSTRWQNGQPAHTYSISFSTFRSPLFGLDLAASAGYWHDPTGNTRYFAPGLSRSLGPGRVSATYQVYRTALGDLVSRTQLLEGALSFPLARRLQGNVRASHQWGAGLSSNRLYGGIWVNF